MAKRELPEALKANLGKGRPKGVPNKTTAAIKDMVLKALSDVGGAEYLARQAEANPGPFMALVGKVLPLQLTGEGGGPVQIARIELVGVQPEEGV